MSPISLLGEEKQSGMLSPTHGPKAILYSLQKRLENVHMVMACMNCGHQWHTTVLRSRLQCPKCKGGLIAAIKNDVEFKEILKTFKKKRLGKDEKKMIVRLSKNASLVANYGKDALLVLAGYGIGSDTAARILAKQKKGEELLQEILEAEITYARTRRFWEDKI
jgi:ATP-dependent Lhr-like helicase